MGRIARPVSRTRTNRSQILMCGCWPHFSLWLFPPNEAELGHIVTQSLQFDGGLAFTRIRYAAGQQFSIIGENVDALTTTRNGDVKLFSVDGSE